MKKNVLILGASGDIGSAIAKYLASQEYSLLLHYHRNKQAVNELLDDLEEEAVLQIMQADLTNIAAIHELCQAVQYRVDAIVHVSGTAQFGLFQDISERAMDQMLMLHVKAPWYITQFFLPEMIRRQEGHLIFITSIWGSVGASNEVIYSSVKGAQNSFVKALAKEVGPSGISVNGISPGFIDTKMNQHLQQDEIQDIIHHIPLNRAGVSADIAHAVDFLLDEKSSYIQGEIINITGGW